MDAQTLAALQEAGWCIEDGRSHVTSGRVYLSPAGRVSLDTPQGVRVLIHERRGLLLRPARVTCGDVTFLALTPRLLGTLDTDRALAALQAFGARVATWNGSRLSAADNQGKWRDVQRALRERQQAARTAATLPDRPRTRSTSRGVFIPAAVMLALTAGPQERRP